VNLTDRGIPDEICALEMDISGMKAKEFIGVRPFWE
jgi:hypothetical protein